MINIVRKTNLNYTTDYIEGRVYKDGSTENGFYMAGKTTGGDIFLVDLITGRMWDAEKFAMPKMIDINNQVSFVLPINRDVDDPAFSTGITMLPGNEYEEGEIYIGVFPFMVTFVYGDTKSCTEEPEKILYRFNLITGELLKLESKIFHANGCTPPVKQCDIDMVIDEWEEVW